jgi:hypothetical protein
VNGLQTYLNIAFTSFREKKNSHRSPIAIGISNGNVAVVLKKRSVQPETSPAGMRRNTRIPRTPSATRSPLKIRVEMRAQRQARNSPISVAKPQPAKRRVHGKIPLVEASHFALSSRLVIEQKHPEHSEGIAKDGHAAYPFHFPRAVDSLRGSIGAHSSAKCTCLAAVQECQLNFL